MKNIIIIAIAALSLSSFAGEIERDSVKVSANSAQGAYEMAQDMVTTIKAGKLEAKLSMLNNCNYTSSEAEDKFIFNRKAWTNTSMVYLNHVTGTYTAIVKVSCKK